MGFRNEHNNNLAQTLREKHISIGRFARSKLNEYSDQVDNFMLISSLTGKKRINRLWKVVNNLLSCFDMRRCLV